MKKHKDHIRIFVARQICPCSTDPDCCPAPRQSEDQIQSLMRSIEQEGYSQPSVYDISDINLKEKPAQVSQLFKEHGYNALPIILVDGEIVAYGIPDKDFIIHAIKAYDKSER